MAKKHDSTYLSGVVSLRWLRWLRLIDWLRWVGGGNNWWLGYYVGINDLKAAKREEKAK
jgi:hypothetical protein